MISHSSDIFSHFITSRSVVPHRLGQVQIFLWGHIQGVMFQLFAQFSNGTKLKDRKTGQIFYKFANRQKVIDLAHLECENNVQIDCTLKHIPQDNSQPEFNFNLKHLKLNEKQNDFYKIFNEQILDHFVNVSGHSMIALTKLIWVKDLKGFVRVHKRFA